MKSRPIRRQSIVLRTTILLSVSYVGVACSDGNTTDTTRYAGALTDIRQTIGGSVSEWATKATDLLSAQVQASGQIDDKAIERGLQPDTARLNSAICTEVSKQKGALELDSPSQTPQSDIARMVEESLMLAMAKRPELLSAVGLKTWGSLPPFVVKDPAPLPDTALEGTPQALATSIKPEFIDKSSGGLALPPVGDANYTAFQQWYSASDNGLYEQASFTAGPVRDELLTCVQDLAAGK